MKKAALILSLIGIALSPPIAAREITLEEALAAVENHFSDKQVELRVIPDSMATDWQLFVDANPMAGWEHECYIAKVPKEGDAAVITDMQRRNYPPDVEMFSPYSSKTGMMKVSALDWKMPITVAKRNLTEQEQAAANRTFAIILNGGCNKNMNYSRYWNNCSFIYKVLRNHYGVPKENIYPLIADGNDPAEDMLIVENTYVSSPTDLDDDGVADIYGASSATSVLGAVNKIMEKARPGDQVFFYVTDHGGSDGNEVSYILMWNEGKLYDHELARTFAQLFDRGIYVNMVLGQCYSGGFIDNFEGKTCVIATACPWDKLSGLLDSKNFDKFLYYWTCGVNMADEQGGTSYSDLNNDHMITMEEAFLHAQTFDPNEEPQYYSNSRKLGKTLSFNHIPSSEEAYLCPVLYMKTSADDDGMEDKPHDIFWNSPDIGFCSGKNNVINHYTSLSNNIKELEVSVKLRNCGSKPFKTGKTLNVYWAKASAPETAATWRGETLTENGTPLGGKIGYHCLGCVILPGDSLVETFKWTLPNSLRLGELGLKNLIDLKLLAYLSDSPYENLPDDYNVNSNRVAQKNHCTFDRFSGSGGIELSVYNPFDVNKEIKLQFTELGNEDNYIYPINLEMDEVVANAWLRGGKKGVGFEQDSNNGNKIALTNKASYITVLMSPGETGTVKVNFDSRYLLSSECQDTLSFAMRQLIGEKEVTGYNFVTHPYEMRPIIIIPGGPGTDIGILKISSERYMLESTSTAGNNSTYLWTDATGNVIGTEKTIYVNPLVTGSVYDVEVHSEDSEIAYASVSLPLNYGIEAVETNGDIATIKLRDVLSTTTSMEFRSVGVMGDKVVTCMIPSGEATAIVDISALPVGICCATMIVEGKVIDNYKFMK